MEIRITARKKKRGTATAVPLQFKISGLGSLSSPERTIDYFVI